MSADQHLLQVRNLSHSYANGNGGVGALDRVSLDVRRESFICVVGPSGCGKTTLLRLLSGLIQPTRGSVIFEGEPLTKPRRRIGFVFQQANLMPWRTTLENIRLPLEIGGVEGNRAEDRVRELVDLVGLKGFEEAWPQDLSGGMAQRVALARALVHEPDLLLLDEPFGSLDALTRERMLMEVMRIWHERAVTALMVTHSISDAVLLADRVVVLSPRPGSVVLNLPIPLKRPRTLRMTYTEEFGELAAKVRSAIGRD
ncbi:MAG: ABC transporter ATP-binding protein [Anaerolineales bacterium]